MSSFAQHPEKLDGPAWRPFAAAALTFGAAGLAFIYGPRLIGADGGAAARAWLAAAAGGPWAPLATSAVFAALAFLGAPQVALIAAAVLAFGPGAGMVDAWIGTMVSALIGYGLGRRFGAGALGVWGGGGARRLLERLARRGLLASLAVRLVPLAPFIFVNMAAGAAGIGLADFAAGTAIGIAPKIILTAVAGRSLAGFAAGGGLVQALVVVAATAGWAALTFMALAWLRRGEPSPAV